MLFLEMYLDGRLLSREGPFTIPSLRYEGQAVEVRIKALRKKYSDEIALAGSEPLFLLSGIPSSLNSFVPLSFLDPGTRK